MCIVRNAKYCMHTRLRVFWQQLVFVTHVRMLLLATGEMATTSNAIDDLIKLINKPGPKSIAWNYFALEAEMEGKLWSIILNFNILNIDQPKTHRHFCCRKLARGATQAQTQVRFMYYYVIYLCVIHSILLPCKWYIKPRETAVGLLFTP